MENLAESEKEAHENNNDDDDITCTEFTEFFWTFPIVLYLKEHDVSETGSVSVLR
jgi:hypothetical protein